MRRLAALFLLALMVLSFCGCAMFYSVSDSIIPSKLTRGTIEDAVYTSPYAGLVFTAPETWVYTTDEGLADLMDVSVEAFNDAGMEFSADALEKQTLYDMMCQDPMTGSSVVLFYENLALTGNTGISETGYIDEAIELLKKAGTVQYDFGKTTEEELCGQTFYVMKADLIDYGASQYYYARKVDKYMLCFVATIASGDDVSDVLDGFTPYEAE